MAAGSRRGPFCSHARLSAVSRADSIAYTRTGSSLAASSDSNAVISSVSAPASCTPVNPSRAIRLRPASTQARAWSGVGGGMADSNSVTARFSSVPEGSPFASCKISPPTGALVARVMPAFSNASVLPHTANPCRLSSTTGWSGTRSLSSRRVG